MRRPAANPADKPGRRLWPGLAFGLAMASAGAAQHSDHAFSHQCKRKLHAIHRAAMAFVAANDGRLPPAYMHPILTSPIRGRGAWHEALAPYLEQMGERVRGRYVHRKRQPDNTVFHCAANPYWYGGYGPNCVGYAWNRNLGMFAAGREARPVRFADVAHKARTILAVDVGPVPGKGPYCHYHAASRRQVGFWHAGKAHVLFMDGHVEALAPNEIQDRWFRIRLQAPASRPTCSRGAQP